MGNPNSWEMGGQKRGSSESGSGAKTQPLHGVEGAAELPGRS